MPPHAAEDGHQDMTAPIIIFAAAVALVSSWLLCIHAWISNESAETERLDAMTRSARCA
jgi:hypothetical protein